MPFLTFSEAQIKSMNLAQLEAALPRVRPSTGLHCRFVTEIRIKRNLES